MNVRLQYALAALSLASLPSTSALGAQLVSLHDVEIGKIGRTQEYVWGFDIEMHHGRILAVCRVPPGWSIAVEDYGEAGMWHEGGGHIGGDARLGHNALNQSNLDRLEDIILIDDLTPNDGQPVTFEGTITVISLGADDGDGPRPLMASNFVLKPAKRCPESN